MKTNSANLLSILSNDNVGFATLAKLEWNSNYYFTDMGSDVVFDGNTYLSSNPLVNLSAPQYSTVIDREAFSLQLSGIGFCYGF